MKVLYAIELDLCIINPDTLINFPSDIILPKYFFTQLNFLKNRDLGNATVAANKIINSLKQCGDTDILLFTNNNGGKVYFIDETINYLNLDNEYTNLDSTNPLDRYLLSLLYISNILEAKIFFLSSSPEINCKCRILNFDPVTLEKLPNIGESWLHTEMLVNLQASNLDIVTEHNILDASETDTTIQIQWQDIKGSQEVNNIKWIDMR